MGRIVGFLKGLLFIYLKWNCKGRIVGLLKESLVIYLKYNCEGGSVGILKDRYLSIWSYIVREEL